ncbi:unnamed protein product [Phytophthora fragariaefolia]|uniref:Unnamed protein product n=1 Tax=Phytophthora fragariaefolia TaxID=1490495 RepID=A0A9W6XE91_9STRA|nr:unnamed protein product [Phytophthora fragariaefolia]
MQTNLNISLPSAFDFRRTSAFSYKLKAKIDQWVADCEDTRHANDLLKALVEDQMGEFGKGRSCEILAEFEGTYFIEKDKAYEAKKKTAISALERRFLAVFGINSYPKED